MSAKSFIVSTGRTGTNFLAERLNFFDGVKAYHQPEPMMGKEASRYLRWKNHTFRKTKIRRFLPYSDWYRLKLRRTRKKLFSSGETFVEANMKLVPLLPVVKKAFPEAFIIQIIRHPGDFASSALNKGMFTRNDCSIRLNPMDTGEMSRSDWKGLNPLQRINWYWLKCNEMIRDHNPDLLLDFSDIFEEDHRGFYKLKEIFGIKQKSDGNIFASKINKTKVRVVPPFSEWNEELVEPLQDSLDFYNELKKTRD